MTIYRIHDFVNAGEIDEMVSALIEQHEAQRLADGIE
jgi:protein subunit release factor A